MSTPTIHRQAAAGEHALGLLYVPYPAAEGWDRPERGKNATASPGFRPRDGVDLALGMVDEAGPVFSDPSAGGLIRRYSLKLGPGKIRVRASALGDQQTAYDPMESQGRLSLRTPRPFDEALEDDETGTRGAIRVWSRRSRMRMVETMCSLDWQPVVASPHMGWRPAMVTLTMPGDWVPLAPDAATFKRKVEAFYKRWSRAWDTPSWFWKLEFQRRGAPHLHIYTALPLGPEFRYWLSRNWAATLFGDGFPDDHVGGCTCEMTARDAPAPLPCKCMCERCKSVRAGTGVDWQEGIRASDPKRLAIYFAKRATGHNASQDKAYQNVVPPEWGGVDTDTGEVFPERAGPGRFWGMRGLARCEGEVELDRVQFVQARRVMRRWAKSRGAKVRSLYGGRMAGGMVLANDAPALLAAMSRWRSLAAGDLPDRPVAVLGFLP